MTVLLWSLGYHVAEVAGLVAPWVVLGVWGYIALRLVRWVRRGY